MKSYIISLAAGFLVGIVYSVLSVRSPAPPLIALVGLFGILLGEQALPVSKQLLSGLTLAAAWRACDGRPHIFGQLPGNEWVPAVSAAIRRTEAQL